MKSTTFRIACLTTALLAPAGLFVRAAGSAVEALTIHAPQLEAKVTFRDGTSRTARLEGVGCTQSICSQTIIRGIGGSQGLVSSSLNSLAKIKDTSAGAASFLSTNGTERRLSLVKDFRVLYLRNQSGGTEKIDLESITSVEFLPAHR
jgi:hypothetical protein